jgi:hypothetical protein
MPLVVIRFASEPWETNMVKRTETISAALLVAGLMISAPACATQTYGYRGPRSGSSREIERQAYDSGYRAGLRAGERDGRTGRSFSFNRHDDWRDADSGYGRGYGDRDWYRQTYRRGFETAYTDAYNRFGNGGRYPRTSPVYPSYPSYPVSPGGRAVLRSPAAQTGYRDGFEAGRDDANSRRAFEPQRSRRYREGDHDYDNRYGSRDEYKREYRAAFQQGYDEGFRGGRR